MRLIIFILFIALLPLFLQAQTANAGSDVNVYLNTSTSATLDGSASSGSTFQWREISTDYSSGATITNATSKVATVSGLPQGIFYFEITVNSTLKDTMVVRVDASPAPANSTFIREFELSNPDFVNTINWRGDTTTYYPTDNATHSQVGTTNKWVLYRDRTNAMTIDSMRGKFIAKIEDGYGGGHQPIGGVDTYYARTELQPTNPAIIDTSHIYVWEWKGYFPQPENYLTGNSQIGVIFQIHSDSGTGENPLGFGVDATGTIFLSIYPNGPRQEQIPVAKLSDFYNKTHTIRVTVREGYGAPNNPAFMKADIDGIQVALRDTGVIGTTDFQDFPKFGGIYDWSNAVVDPLNTTRHRTYATVIESMKQYSLSEMPPIIRNSKLQILALPTSYTTLSGYVTAGTSAITSYQWTKISGGSATIASPNSLSTSITGLSAGTYSFNLKVTDENGLSTDRVFPIIVETNHSISATGYNYDVIIDGILNSDKNTLRNKDLQSGYTIYSDGYSPNSTPLPFGLAADGHLVSTSVALYQLQPYNQNNALWLSSGQSGTLTLSTPASFDKIKIALSTGGTSMQYQINYSDGTNDIFTHTVDTWLNPLATNYAANNLGITTDGNFNYKGYNILEDSVSPNPAKTVNSITFTTTGEFASIFALTSVSAIAAPPTVSTSGNQTIITNSTTIFSTPVAASGQTITGILWTDITGSGSATITSPTSQNTGITGLSVGTHTFRVEVTQSDGQKAHADVSVTLNAAPTANAGTDQTITLPTSSVTLSGSGTVASGQTASYEWTKVSGAGTQTITGNTTLTPAITGMTTAGDYVFQLKVTQTDTQFALSTVTVHINAAPTPQKPFINLRKPTIVIQIH